jgi:hypothetical protein
MFYTEDYCYELFNELLKTYKDSYIKFDEIRNTADKVVKSFNKAASTYGMYYPDEAFYKFFKYRGRITKSETKYTYKYYYHGDKVFLTERYSEEYDSATDSYLGIYRLISYIYYVYQNDYIDIIRYRIDAVNNEVTISGFGRVFYEDNKIKRFIESDVMMDNIVESYREFLFNDNVDYILERYFYFFTLGGKIEKHEKISKVELYSA